MATMSDVSIINWNKAEAKPVASGLKGRSVAKVCAVRRP